MKFDRLIAVDPSLTCSGWALFSIASGKILAIGKLRSAPPTVQLQIRIMELQARIEEVITTLDLGMRDLLVCEAETTVRDPRAAFRVERVRSIFEVVARAKGLTVPGRINPRTVQSELIGMRGVQKKRTVVKEAALSVASSLYRKELEDLGFDTSPRNLTKNQDIVDALLVGTVALARVRSAITCGLEIEKSFEARNRKGNWNSRSGGR